MAKLYYGDENNTAVEINVGGVSGDYLPLTLESDTEVNGNGRNLTFSNGDVTFDGNVITNGLMKFRGDRLTISADNAMETATIETSTADLIIDSGSNPITITGPTTFNNPVTVPKPTTNGHAANKQYVDEAVASAGGGVSFTPTQMTSERNDISSYINQSVNEDVEYGSGLIQKLTYGAIRYSEHLVKLDMLFDIIVGALYDGVATFIGMNMQNLFNNLIVPSLRSQLGVGGNPTVYGIVTATETYDSRYADVFYFMPNEYLLPDFESGGTNKLDGISKGEGFPIEWVHSLTLYFPNN